MTALFDEIPAGAAVPIDPEPHTESSVLALLRAKYERDVYGNGPRYAFAQHVRNRAGFDASRTFDAVAVDLWPASGLLVHIFEVKVARSDWLRELKEPEKAQAAIDLGDTFSVVAPAGVVKPEELPPGWGWYVAGRGIITRRAPSVRADRGKSVPRTFVAPLLRAAIKTAKREAIA